MISSCLIATVAGFLFAISSQASPLVEYKSAKSQLSSSIITFGYDHFNDPGRCVKYVEKAHEASGSDRLMFVPTLYFYDERSGINWNNQTKITHLCYFPKSGNAQKCDPVNQGQIQKFQDSMQQCLGRAVQLGFDISLTPHLDDGAQKGLWRNGLVFGPLDNLGGFTYYDVVLKPLINALNAVKKPETKVWFGMQGEMSACVFMRPKDWMDIIPKIKSELGGGDKVKVGISTNFNKLCHCLHVDVVETGLYLKKFKQDFHQIKNLVDSKALKDLYQAVDFFGISSYPSLNPDFATYQLENAAREFDEEISLFGINIRSLISQGKELVFAEYGLGGGRSQDGKEPALTAAEAARYPFFTIFDLNENNNPWKTPEVREYRHRFFNETVKLLSGNVPGSQYKVSSIYNWNLGTYDFQGITNSISADQTLIDLVKKHNLAARGK